MAVYTHLNGHLYQFIIRVNKNVPHSRPDFWDIFNPGGQKNPSLRSELK